ncbi:TetR/AcrR family transcriptional regulator [Acidisoma cladoniae]|jgi:AcrR family transcriptional regulator|uniref:TetR/AcrR family transcriptional regulator n=1 Tax=Acidisoma cladoniae TaxID=3040935 RepID=UPI00254E23D9|nr:TetR/AcrR family transcriptional regulator [Acidisoma sp. PAMC 29798]
MDNPTRSLRSRNAVLEAALAIIARDGPARLTLDAIAREAGISKGGLMHQFATKEAVLKALLQRQTEYFEDFSRNYLAASGVQQSQPVLEAQIATIREAMSTPSSIVFAILGAAAHDPALHTGTREADVEKIKAIRAEASDPDLALLRWVAAWGLTLTSMLGLSALSEEDRQRLFDRLLDEAQWSAASKAKPRDDPSPPKRAPRKTAKSA